MRKTPVTVTCCTAVASVMTFYFTSFTGHRPAQREWAQTGLIGPMRGAIPTQSHNLTTQPSHTTRVYIPLFFSNSGVGSFTSHKNRSVKVLWDRTYGFSSLSKKTKNLTICRGHYKGSTKSSQLFKDPECCSSQGLNLWPPTQPTGTLPTELIRWQFIFPPYQSYFCHFFFQSLKKEFIR